MILTRRRFFAVCGATLATHAVWAGDTHLLQVEGPAFGARWRVRAAADADAPAIARAVTGVVTSVDAAMSPFRATSEIAAFNRADTTDWLPLSQATLATVTHARGIAERTRGAFDPTLGGLVGRYGFGPIQTAPQGAFADMAFGNGMIRKAHPRQTLDLCGIAKGHALDRCATALRSIGLNAFFIELGGEVLSAGARPDGQPWRAGVAAPFAGATAPHCIVDLSTQALATSGDLINSYRIAGHRYCHIIDPALMQPARNALASVSVFAPKAITADALATALFAMGTDRGADLAETAGLPALFVIRDGPRLKDVMTAGFSDRIRRG